MHRISTTSVSSALLGLSLVALLAACGKSEGSGGGAPETASLAKLGLKAEVPGGSTVSDAIIGDGVMIQGPDLVVTVEPATDSTPKTAAEAKEEASMYSPKKVETEDLADGFALTFENTGGMGTNYFVNVRREIGGKAYWCTTTASKPAQQKNALAACKSLAQ
jgi:hypothetical protein